MPRAWREYGVVLSVVASPNLNAITEVNTVLTAIPF